MSSCGVCIGGGDNDGYSEFYTLSTPKARKPHMCCECGRTIQRGDRYQRYASKFDGQMTCDCTCLACAEIQRTFACGEGYPIGQLWQDMEDFVFPVMNTGCLDRLETAAAKAYLLERWRNWKFA